MLNIWIYCDYILCINEKNYLFCEIKIKIINIIKIYYLIYYYYSLLLNIWNVNNLLLGK